MFKAQANNLLWRTIPYILAAILYLAHKRMSQSSRPKSEALLISREIAKIARTITEPTYPERQSMTENETTKSTKRTTRPTVVSDLVEEQQLEVLKKEPTETKKSRFVRALLKSGTNVGGSFAAGVGVGVGLAVAKLVVDQFKD